MSNYKTMLSKSLHLDVTDWEVGLAEIIYPITWDNVKGASFEVNKLERNKWKWDKCRVPNGRYHSPEALISTLQEKIDLCLGDSQREKIKLGFLPAERKTKVYIAERYGLQLSPALSQALGFGDTRTKIINTGLERVMMNDRHHRIDQETSISPFVADVDRSLRTMFIHCNIVEPQLVGDMHVPLLRTVTVKGNTGDVVAETFTNIHYMGIERSTFQEIEIHITDDIGRNIPFDQGRVIVKLHFRRKT